jgi:hypothetical protein
MGFMIQSPDIEDIINCVPLAVERVLKVIQVKIDNFEGFSEILQQ